MSNFSDGIRDIYAYALLREVALITREYEGESKDDNE